MTVETSTANILLGLIAALQVWIVRELFKLKHRLSIIFIHCKSCRNKALAAEFDTDHITKST